MKVAVNRRYRFCASHRLHSPELSEAENQALYGKCNNPFGHGHDYTFDFGVSGELDTQTGLVVRLADLDALVADQILSAFDHRNLNVDIEEFRDLVPTTENVAKVIAERLGRNWHNYFPCSQAHINRIFIQETDRNSFEVLVPEADQPMRYDHAEWNESEIVNA